MSLTINNRTAKDLMKIVFYLRSSRPNLRFIIVINKCSGSYSKHLRSIVMWRVMLMDICVYKHTYITYLNPLRIAR